MSTVYLREESDIYDLLDEAETESKIWRRDYQEFERLADNDLIEDLDENLPEVNDGSLAASLFKLPKRIVNSDLKGRAKATDSDDAWITELANMQWENEIIPNANSQAPFHRKWKNAVRKAAIYGSVPIITLFVERGDYTGSDFIVAQPQDVKLEPGKVSDYDSDILFWDVYFTRLQVQNLVKRAKTENEEALANPDEDAYNKWHVKELEQVLKTKEESSRDPNEDSNQSQKEGVRQKGYHFTVVVQRGVDAPFFMFHKDTKKIVREWSNPDPTGDVPIHFLYCYQDFINPYGVGIVKLAGGTQNVLDYMRQADVLATQLGLRPPISISGDLEDVDLDSIVHAQDAQWYIGEATVKREANDGVIYQALPERMSMYKTALNQLIPTGDTSIASGSGDPNYSKTPEGVKFQANNLSIDDDDFRDNLYMTYAAVAKSMINTHFANMQGTKFMKLTDEEREVLARGGLEIPEDDEGMPSNEIEFEWDEARASFDYEMIAEQDKAKDDEKRLDGLLKVAEMVKTDPTLQQSLVTSGVKLNTGELYREIINLTTDNEKIIEKISPEDQAKEELLLASGDPTQTVEPTQGNQDVMPAEDAVIQDELPEDEEMRMSELPEGQSDKEDDEVNIQAIMEQFKIGREHAMAMREAELAGYDPDEILAGLERALTLQKEIE